jgi:hypothetical protein
VITLCDSDERAVASGARLTIYNPHMAVADAIARGRLDPEPPACAACGVAGRRYSRSTKTGRRWSLVYHHHSYARRDWLNVTPLCRSCHDAVHRGIIPEPWEAWVANGGGRPTAPLTPTARHQRPDPRLAWERLRESEAAQRRDGEGW